MALEAIQGIGLCLTKITKKKILHKFHYKKKMKGDFIDKLTFNLIYTNAPIGA